MTTTRWLIAAAVLLTAGCDNHFGDDCGWDDWDDDSDVVPCDGPWCRDDPRPRTRADGGTDAGVGDAGSDTVPVECSSAADCAETEACVEAACVPLDEVCRNDLGCGAGRGCVDGACRPFCDSDAECTAGTACVDRLCLPAVQCATSADCVGGARCVGERCLMSCDAIHVCGADEVCDASGWCRPDVAPRPFCDDDSDCATGHLCLDGVCRTPCPSGTDDECLHADVHLAHCNPSTTGLLLCFARNETDPECVTAGDCTGGESCHDAICR